MAICAAAPLPQTGEHYFEVTFHGRESEKDVDATPNSRAAVGLWCAPKLGIDNNTLATKMTKAGKPFWGLRGDRDNDALRVRGKAFGKVGLNSSGWAISNGDTVGVLVNMDTPVMMGDSGQFSMGIIDRNPSMRRFQRDRCHYLVTLHTHSFDPHLRALGLQV